MELRQVRLFLAVAAEGSITRAARRMHLTQSALSRQVKALEEQLGTALLERGAHSVALTPAGRLLAVDGERWAAMADELCERVRRAGQGESLHIGYAPTLAGDLLGIALERFSQLHPGVRVKLSDRTTAEMRLGLKNGEFDLVLTAPDRNGGGVLWQELLRRSWRVMLPAGHPLAERDWLKPEDLANERWLIFGREEYPDYWQRISAYFREHGLRPVIAGEFDGRSSLATAVAAGMGVALVAESRIGLPPGLQLLDLRPGPERVVVAAGFAAGSEPGMPCRVLLGELQAVVAERGTGEEPV